jgi:hypothetical protein
LPEHRPVMFTQHVAASVPSMKAEPAMSSCDVALQSTSWIVFMHEATVAHNVLAVQFEIAETGGVPLFPCIMVVNIIRWHVRLEMQAAACE